MSEVVTLPRPRTSTATLIRSTGLVAAVKGLDFGLSFLVSVLLASRFGATGQLDAFFLARRTTVGFADTIRKLVGQVVLPPAIAAIDRGETPSIHVLPKRIYWFLAGFVALTLTGTFLPSTLVHAFAPGFSGGRHDLTAEMMAIMMPLLPIAIVASLLAAVLQAKRRYLLTEGTNLVQRGLLVLVLALAVPPLGIVAGAWTMLASGIVGLAILVAGAWTIVRHRPRIDADPGAVQDAPVSDGAAPALAATGGGVAAAIVINIYFQGTALLDFAWASTTPDGGVAALEYGARLVSLVPGLLMSSLAVVLQPELVRAVQHPDRRAAAAGLQRFQRIAFFAQLPVSIGMMLGAELMVRILFGYGAFDEASIGITAATTAGYAAAAMALAPMTATTSAIYADPRGPSFGDLAIIAAGGLLIRESMLAIAAPAWGAAGIAWAAALSTLLAALLAQGVAIRRFRDFDMAAQTGDMARTALCGAAAAAAGAALLFAVAMPGGVVPRLALLAGLGALVVASYLGTALMLGVPEVASARDVALAAVARRRARR